MNSGRPEPRGVHVGPFNGARQTFSTERHESTAMLMFCRVLMRTHLLFLNDCVITTTIMSFWLLLLVLSERLISCCSSERWQTSSNRVTFLQNLRRQQRLQTLAASYGESFFISPHGGRGWVPLNSSDDFPNRKQQIHVCSCGCFSLITT